MIRFERIVASCSKPKKRSSTRILWILDRRWSRRSGLARARARDTDREAMLAGSDVPAETNSSSNN